MISEPVTAGERLCQVLFLRVVEPSDWDSLRSSIPLRSHTEQYVELFQEVLTTNLTCRVVSLGCSLAATRSIEDPVFGREFKEALGDSIGIPRSVISDVLRNAVPAVAVAGHGFTPKEKKQIRDAARALGASCYMCGQALDYSPNATGHQVYTLEHVWPNSYGGDSIPENALPACQGCNVAKGNFATWGMVAVQSLILGLTPDPDKLDGIDKTFKFALHQRAAREIARTRPCTMARALKILGPWRQPKIVDTADSGHFFNLQVHTP